MCTSKWPVLRVDEVTCQNLLQSGSSISKQSGDALCKKSKVGTPAAQIVPLIPELGIMTWWITCQADSYTNGFDAAT